MKILVIGASGLLGKYLLQTSPEHDTVGTWYTNHVFHIYEQLYQLDVLNKSQINYVFDRIQPDIVIHCAANGSVDYAEKDYQGAYAVNYEGTKNLYGFAKEYKAKFVYISSNAVFRGDSPPYNESSISEPINCYGSIKRHAENLIRDGDNWLIFRPYLLYGWNWDASRKNWVTTIIKNCQNKKETFLVDDTFWQPTYVEDTARAIWKLLEYENEIFNISADEMVTLYNFGEYIAEVFDLDKKLIKPISTFELNKKYPNLAPRPINTFYDLDKIKRLGIQFSNVKKGLEKMRSEWL